MKRLIGYFIFLLALCCCTTEAERTKMRAGLDSINVLNRTDKPFTVQDVEPYMQFFDDHGTPNERLLAHYLLGRAYYEHGEAPMALQCFHDAIFNAYPNFSELMTTHCQDLDEREYRVCLLIRADFKPNSISSMLVILPSVITQLRTGLYLKLFGRRGTSKEFDSLLRKIY